MEKMKNKKLNVSQTQENKILRKVVEITNSELDLRWILHEVVEVVSDMTKGDSVFIYLFDEKKRHLILMASKTPHKEELGKVNLKIGEGITGWVASKNKLVAISHQAYQDARFKSFDILPEDRYEAFLSIPIVNKKECVGVVNVQHKKPHEYSERTVSLISLIVKQIGGVIENACLYEETKKKALQFDSLVKVSKSITSEHYLDEILNLIVIVTAEMLNSRICSIMLLDKKGSELAIKATQSLSKEYRLKPNLKVNGSLSGEVFKNKKPAMIYDVRKEKKYRFRELAVKENLTSMLCVPMVVKDKAVGLINVYTKEPHSFIQEEVNVLQMVANQAAVTIENTKLIEEALKAKEALETRKLIDRAKCVLMRSNNLDEDIAYSLIHKKSMDSRRSMKEVAESILLVSELQKKGGIK
ncbi:MAG: GAF and ANTAR domain-containing protein [Candidatus Omnitrophica bacterium]|nr:GAF and ANTAR domain-containing protein [Candidatus Omnitrophota bacterium]